MGGFSPTHCFFKQFSVTMVFRINPKALLKRIVSIFFLCVFLFQVGGYYLVFWAMEHTHNAQLLQRLDANDYSSQDAIVISVPLNLPYPVSSDGFKRINGEFEKDGQSYKLVKQKWQNDTLFIVLLKDKENTRLSAVFNDFTKLSHSLPVSSKKAMTFLTKLHKDFKSTEFRMLYKSRLMYERTYFAEASPKLLSIAPATDTPPPELVF